MRLRLPTLLAWLTASLLLAAPTKEQQRALDGAFAGIVKGGDRLGARDLARYALEATAAGEAPAKVAQALELLRTQQELRPGACGFRQLPLVPRATRGQGPQRRPVRLPEPARAGAGSWRPA